VACLKNSKKVLILEPEWSGSEVSKGQITKWLLTHQKIFLGKEKPPGSELFKEMTYFSFSEGFWPISCLIL
jgi:hypothetical protein